MKLALHILRKSLADLRSNAVPFAFNGIVVLCLLVVLDVIFPTTINVVASGSAEKISTTTQYIMNTLIKLTPISVFMAAFLVQAHKKILHPASGSSTWFRMRLTKTELRFMVFGFFIGILVTVPVVFSYGYLGRLIFSFDLSADQYVFYILYGNQVSALILTVLLSYRFVLFAPLVVVGKDWPLGKAWNLSKGRFVVLAALILIPAICERVTSRVVGLASDPLAITIFGTNVTQSILSWTIHLLFAAYAAILLSNTYLEFTREESA